MSNVFSPFTIKSITFKNRLVVSPMCQYSCVDGFANDWHLVHLGSRAVGGAALIVTEAAAVSAAGRITPNDLGIYSDDHIEVLQRINHFIKAQGAVAGIQLAHAGRKASHRRPWDGGAALGADENPWTTQAPSAIPYKQGEPLPEALTQAAITTIVDAFKMAALRSKTAGFEVIEIHAAHGYLIHEFLSPLSNQRNDMYGGSFENRIRLLLEIIAAVKTVWDEDLPLFVRLSATDWVAGGWTIEDTIALAKILKTAGVDLIDCSSGGNSPQQKISPAPLYQAPFAARVKQEAAILTGAVGLITTAEEAAHIIESGVADLVFMGRQLLREPYFPLHAAAALNASISWPVQYERAK